MFITFEGMDGVGKTTQIERLRERLVLEGYTPVLTREPGGCPIAEAIRHTILDPGNAAMTPLCEAMLYAAARAQHVREFLRPALAEGRVALCDRYLDSSVAYQGFGRGLGAELIRQINGPAVDGLMPERTYLLMLSPEEARARRAAREADRIEREDEAFFARVEEGFSFVAKNDPDRVMVLDAARREEDIADEIGSDFTKLIKNKKGRAK